MAVLIGAFQFFGSCPLFHQHRPAVRAQSAGWFFPIRSGAVRIPAAAVEDTAFCGTALHDRLPADRAVDTDLFDDRSCVLAFRESAAREELPESSVADDPRLSAHLTDFICRRILDDHLLDLFVRLLEFFLKPTG